MFKNGYNTSIQKELSKIREIGELKPVELGFRSWRNYDIGKFLQFSRGSTVLIGGEPHHGKTYFTNELVIQLIEKHNWKIAVFSTEAGSVAKQFSTYCGLYIGKPYSKIRPDGKINHFAMTDDEIDIATAKINQCVRIFEQDRKKPKYQTIENIYKMVAECEQQEDIKFDCVVIDPIYDVDDFEPKAEEVKRVLTTINYECEVNNRVDIIVNHVSETQKFVDKSGTRRKLRALADEFYGGKNNQRKAMLQILVERAIPNLHPDDPADFVPENQTNVHVLKAKPEGVAKMGVYPIFWDWKTRRYYENFEGDYHYADCSMLRDDKPYSSESELPKVEPTNAFRDDNTRGNELPF